VPGRYDSPWERRLPIVDHTKLEARSIEVVYPLYLSTSW
jgi:hypothetical protein